VTLDYGKYIEVNLSKQHLWVWQDHNVIYETPITSGATGAGYGTVTGLFSIYYKTTNTRLRGYQYGYNYDVPVKYWMPFYSGYGLHDAEWRNGNFGGSDYYYGGSHGCVNLPDAAAAFIYNWAEVGTPVWVHK
jgi:lipoprotein-anchoring transpeptidase ErfK/SrfK